MEKEIERYSLWELVRKREEKSSKCGKHSRRNFKCKGSKVHKKHALTAR